MPEVTPEHLLQRALCRADRTARRLRPRWSGRRCRSPRRDDPGCHRRHRPPLAPAERRRASPSGRRRPRPRARVVAADLRRERRGRRHAGPRRLVPGGRRYRRHRGVTQLPGSIAAPNFCPRIGRHVDGATRNRGKRRRVGVHGNECVMLGNECVMLERTLRRGARVLAQLVAVMTIGAGCGGMTAGGPATSNTHSSTTSSSSGTSPGSQENPWSTVASSTARSTSITSYDSTTTSRSSSSTSSMDPADPRVDTDANFADARDTLDGQGPCSSPIGPYHACVGTCGCQPRITAPVVGPSSVANECGQPSAATITGRMVSAYNETATLSPDGTMLVWQDGSVWVRSCP
jgi:hypothetical protein